MLCKMTKECKKVKVCAHEFLGVATVSVVSVAFALGVVF